MVLLPLRKEGDVSGPERSSMRSGEAIVGGMMAGRVRRFYDRRRMSVN